MNAHVTQNAKSSDQAATRADVLDIKDLSLRYGAHAVLKDFSLTVREGHFVCLLGPSGCGKTSVLKVVAGLNRAVSGAVKVDGKPIDGPGSERSMVFQNYGLLPWRNVQENVEFGLEIRGIGKAERQEIARREIRRIGLGGFEKHYPSQLSGGMQQRVGLARAFTKNPRLLLMDEPFAAVDAQTREHLQDELLKIWELVKTTVIFVTHSIEEAIYLGDRVIVMGRNGGNIVGDYDVELPRPRYENDIKSSAHFGELRHKIREALRGTEKEAVI